MPNKINTLKFSTLRVAFARKFDLPSLTSRNVLLSSLAYMNSYQKCLPYLPRFAVPVNSFCLHTMFQSKNTWHSVWSFLPHKKEAIDYWAQRSTESLPRKHARRGKEFGWAWGWWFRNWHLSDELWAVGLFSRWQCNGMFLCFIQGVTRHKMRVLRPRRFAALPLHSVVSIVSDWIVYGLYVCKNEKLSATFWKHWKLSSVTVKDYQI